MDELTHDRADELRSEINQLQRLATYLTDDLSKKQNSVEIKFVSHSASAKPIVIGLKPISEFAADFFLHNLGHKTGKFILDEVEQRLALLRSAYKSLSPSTSIPKEVEEALAKGSRSWAQQVMEGGKDA